MNDGDVVLYHGDVIDVLRRLPAGVAQTCITSPPYWGLRSYLEDGHDDKHAELGLEATPELYVERMVAVFREVWRVLRDDGTVWLNLGDSYNANQGAGFDTHSDGGARKAAGASPAIKWGKPKDLVGIPWRVAFALQADGWYLRSDIVWSKPNPMPESVTDRPTKAHEYLFLLSKRPRYFYDADSIREPHQSDSFERTQRPGDGVGNGTGNHSDSIKVGPIGATAAGRNRRSVWTIPTEPFPEAHFATYPQRLVEPCILAGTSEHGECPLCGAPWRRQVTRDPEGTETKGWKSSCSCPQFDGEANTDPQLVLDPFIGSGTTALVARNHARRCIGIDLSESYLTIAAKRLQQLSLLA